MNQRRRAGWLGCSLLAAVVLAGTVYWVGGGSDQFRGLRARMRHPHVILVSFDTLNVWYTSLFSDDGAPTPALEEVAGDGVWLEHAYTSVPITLPSHTALLTGDPPWTTGVFANGDTASDDLETLPEILSRHGYRTAAFVSLAVLNADLGLDQGFATYDPVPMQALGRGYRTADEVVEPAARWIEEHHREPFFAWVHVSDPHGPYLTVDEPPDTELLLDDTPLGRWTLGREERAVANVELPPGRHTLAWRALPGREGERRPTPVLEVLSTFALEPWAVEPLEKPPFERRLSPSWALELRNPRPEPVSIPVSFRGRWKDLERRGVRARYRAEVTYADRHLGELRRLVDRLGIGDETLWVVVSDHGEGLYHHGVRAHAANNREDQLRALLLLAGPDIPTGRRLERPVALLQDVHTTILELLGLPVADEIDGRSLVACWNDGCGGGRREWIAYGLDRRRDLRSLSVYRWPRKALWSSLTRPGVFDLTRDPREQGSLHGLPRDPALLPQVADAIEDPSSAALVQRLHRHVQAFETVVTQRRAGALTDEQREMLENLGYL